MVYGRKQLQVPPWAEAASTVLTAWVLMVCGTWVFFFLSVILHALSPDSSP